MTARRRHPGVTGELASVNVSVALDDGESVAGTLLEFTPAGVVIRVEAGPAAWLEVGQVVRAQLSGSPFAEPVVAPARLQFKLDEERRVQCGFRFLAPADLERKIPAPLRELFNRRRMERVRPRVGETVWVRMKVDLAGGLVEKARGDLADISGVGLAVLVDAGAAGPFLEADYVDLRFRLPDQAGEVNVIGRVRYQLRLGGRFRYGIEFDRCRTEDFVEQQARVLEYVEERRHLPA